MANDIPPPFPPPVQPQKKGLPPLAWAGIGCGGLAIIAGVLCVIGLIKAGKSIAESVSKAVNEHPAKEAVATVFKDSPSFEKTAENPDVGTFTLRVKAGGEEVPTTYDDWLHGKVMIKDASGAAVPALQGDLSKIPAWVPRYPGATGEVSLLHQESPTQIHGILVADTTDSKEAIEVFFEAQSKKLFGFTSSSKSFSEINGKRRVDLSFSGGKQKFEIQAYGMPGAPMTMVTIYTEEK
jgi:hypothetical protein